MADSGSEKARVEPEANAIPAPNPSSSPSSSSVSGEELREPRWHRWLFRQVDVSGLVFLRIAFGSVMFMEIWRFFSHGDIARYWIEPDFHFKYLGFEWVHPLPGDWMYVHFLVLGLLALFIAFGFLYRLSATLFFLGYTYIFLAEQAAYQNHYYLICLASFLMIFVPANAAFSLDVKLGLRKRQHRVAHWSRILFCFQVGAVYFFGGIAKLNADWLRGEPMRMWLGYRDDFPLIGRFLASEPAVWFYSIGGVVFDLLIPFFLAWKRTRAVAFVLVVLFHMNNEMLFNIGIFPILGTVLTTAFFSPDWPRRFLHERWFKPPLVDPVLLRKAAIKAGHLPWKTLTHRAVGVFVCVYIAWQVFMPLRHFLYPGDPNWTEEGHRFSWHMKLRDKHPFTSFVVSNVQTGVIRTVEPKDFLTYKQVHRAMDRPDMILQAAHYLAERERKLSGENCEVVVQVHTNISLNGRDPQALIDPMVDLAAEKRGLGHAPWIVPLTTPLRDDPKVPRPEGEEPELVAED